MKFVLVIVGCMISTVLGDVSHLFNHDGYNYERPQLGIQQEQSSFGINPSPLPQPEYLPPIPQAQPQQIPVETPNYIETASPLPPPVSTYVPPAPPIIQNIPSFTSPDQKPEYLPPPPPVQSIPFQNPEYLPPRPIQSIPVQQPIPTFNQQPINRPEPIRRPIYQISPPAPIYRQQTQAISVQQNYLPPTQLSVQSLAQPQPIFKSQPQPFSFPAVTSAPRFIQPPPSPSPQFFAPSPRPPPPPPQTFAQPIQTQVIVPQIQSSGYNYDAPNTAFFS